MRAVLTPGALAVGALLVTGIVIIDAASGGHGDLVVISTAALILQAAALVGRGRRRHHVPLRPDLARWVEERAAQTGEPADAIVDRAVAGFAAGLVSGPSGPEPIGGG